MILTELCCQKLVFIFNAFDLVFFEIRKNGIEAKIDMTK